MALTALSDWDPTKWIIFFLHVYTTLVPSIARTPESSIRKAKAHVHRAEADRLDASVPTEERVCRLEELPVWSRAEVRKRHGEWVVGREGKRRRVLLIVEGCVVDAGPYLDDHVRTQLAASEAEQFQPGGSHLLLSHCVFQLPSTSSFTAPIEIDRLSCPSSPLIGSVYSSGSSVSETPTSSASSSDLDFDVVMTPTSSAPSSDSDTLEKKELRNATLAFFGGMNNHSGAAKERMRCMRIARLADDSA